ncbi:unnamed protein product [Ilex paraguariensis]|uniref:Uncharacterized protein n=1 Tax=Ilex paraguariensis TaxID=185542 RepID=A0ABC8SML8_9AQUA
MQQADQTVQISLRPGGVAGTRGSRFALSLSSSSTSVSSDSFPLRRYGFSGFKTCWSNNCGFMSQMMPKIKLQTQSTPPKHALLIGPA